MEALPEKVGRGRPRRTWVKGPKGRPIDIFSELQLTNRQILYVMERFSPENHDDRQLAYKKAGFQFKSKAVANAAISRLENQPNIKEAFSRYVEWVMESEKNKLRLKILEELQIQAFYDPADFFNHDGTLKPLDQIDPKLRGCVCQIDTKAFGKDAHEITNYKLVDKRSAMKNLIDFMALGEGSGEVTIKARGGKKGTDGNDLPSISITVGG